MGLAEKRAIAAVKDGSFVTFKKDLETVLGAPIDINVNWDQLAVEDMSHLYADCIPKVYFATLIDAFKSICSDSMGKEALQAAIKKIEIKNTDNISNEERAFKFLGGTLIFDHGPVTNVDNLSQRVKALTEVMEKAL